MIAPYSMLHETYQIGGMFSLPKVFSCSFEFVYFSAKSHFAKT